MSYQKTFIVALFSTYFGSFYSTPPLLAQITPDRTLGNEASVVMPNATIKDASADLIEGGAIRENNLFHSFSEFNIPAGNSVYFASPEGIANILTRITGNNVSEIFGTLGIDGAANLFLLNPNGIVFGENASLDVNGSFLATTADNYIFDNEFAYGANNPEVPPLLTVNIPVGLQFGAIANPIKVENAPNDFIELGDFDVPVGIGVNPEQNITLLGGDLLFAGGHLTSFDSTINLGSVAPDSLVKIVPTDSDWTIDYQGVDDFQDITLTQGTFITNSGEDGTGDTNIQAKTLSVREFSQISKNNFGTEAGGNITVKTTEKVELSGLELGQEDLDPTFEFSFIGAETYGDGGGANLSIQTKALYLSDESVLSTTSFGKGNAGKININASEEIIISSGLIENSAFDLGDAGKINITSNSMELGIEDNFESTGYISSSTSQSGSGGEITIDVQQLDIFNGSFIDNATFSSGDAGYIILNAEILNLTNFALIDSSTLGTGNGGNIIINAGTVSLNGGIISNYTFGTGNAGDTVINTETLSVANGSIIDSSAIAEGNGGNIIIQADLLEVKGKDPEFPAFSSQIAAGVFFGGSGDGGNIELDVKQLKVSDGGRIDSSTFNEGNGGTVKIRAETVELTGTNPDSFDDSIGSGIYVGSTDEGFGNERLGNAGNLEMNTGILTITDGATISAFSEINGDAGSINIESDSLELRNDSTLSVSNLGEGNSGNLNIITQDLSLSNGSIIEAEVNSGSRGNINLATDNIVLNSDSEISAIARGTSTGGNIEINNLENILLQDNSQIIADAEQGQGGNIKINTQGYFISADSLVSAGSDFGLDGNIEIETINGDRNLELAVLPTKTINAAEKITTGCNLQSDFAIAGKGGLPANPSQYLRGQAVWQDLRLLGTATTMPESNLQSKIIASKPMVEAQGWKINNFGKIELISINSDQVAQDSYANCHSFD